MAKPLFRKRLPTGLTLLALLAGCAPQVIRYTAPPKVVLQEATPGSSADLIFINASESGTLVPTIYPAARRCAAPQTLSRVQRLGSAVAAVPAGGEEIVVSLAWTGGLGAETCTTAGMFTPEKGKKYSVAVSLRGGYCHLVVRDATTSAGDDLSPHIRDLRGLPRDWRKTQCGS